MTTEVRDDREHDRYLLSVDGEVVGTLTYQLRPGLIDVIHTEVDPDYGGRGLAGILARAVLDDARARGLAVLPHCPYVARFISGHRDEYLDLVPEADRHRFGLAG